MDRLMKRKMLSRKKYVKKTRVKSKRRFAGKAGIVRVVSRMMNKKIETKQSQAVNVTYQQISHNSFIILDSAVLKTSKGQTILCLQKR